MKKTIRKLAREGKKKIGKVGIIVPPRDVRLSDDAEMAMFAERVDGPGYLERLGKHDLEDLCKYQGIDDYREMDRMEKLEKLRRKM